MIEEKDEVKEVKEAKVEEIVVERTRNNVLTLESILFNIFPFVLLP